jgi:hypothetical protein
MVLRYTTLGLMPKAVQHKNHTKIAVQNTENGVQRAMVCQQPHTPHRLQNTIRQGRDQPNNHQIPLHTLAGHPNDRVCQLRVPPEARSQKKTAPTVAGPQTYCNNRHYQKRSVISLRSTVAGQHLHSKCKQPTHLLKASSKQIVNIARNKK